MAQQPTGCCTPFDPAPWDGAVVEWNGKKFVFDSVYTAFYWPLNFGSVISRMMKHIDAVGVQVPDMLCLSEHASKWKMGLYVATSADVPTLTNVTLSGKFVFKVYEGNYSAMSAWIKDFEAYTKAKGFTIEKQYFWYTTCPKCAKAYGKNYVVLVGKVA